MFSIFKSNHAELKIPIMVMAHLTEYKVMLADFVY